MSLTGDLSTRHAALWEAMVTHPFVTEMGDGTLPVAKFQNYFVEDFVFVRDLVKMVALGISKAPGFAEATVLNRFLEGVLDPEGDLFERAFQQMGVSEEQYTSASASPTTRAFGDFLVRTGYEGDFFDIATVLFVTEGTYLDWGTRLISAGKKPDNAIYDEWITIHGPDVLGELVEWLGSYLDSADLSPARVRRADDLFLTALRYECLFWEAGERDWGLASGD